MSKRPTGRVRLTNLVAQHRSLAESFLKAQQETQAGRVPKNFSGVLTPKFGEYIMVWQFDRNKLVGGVCIHVNNVEQMGRKMNQSKDGWDYMTKVVPTEEEEEQEEIELDDDPELD